MKILFYQWHSFMNRGIENALGRMGIEYDVLFFQQEDWEKDEGLGERLKAALQKSSYGLVLSVNFAPVVSQVCEEAGIRYVSWIYDSPIHIRDLSPMKNSCNDIYIFDRGEVESFKEKGITVKHMPLAVDTEVFASALKNSFTTDVTLVGSMYKTLYRAVSAAVGDGERGFLDGVIASQMAVSGGFLIDQVVDDAVVDRVNKGLAEKCELQVEKRELTYMLACEATHRQRFLAASILSAHFSFDLFSAEKDEELGKVNFRGYADYYKDMPAAFSASRINLNIPLCTIRTGVSLRVMDVLGCGGFLISGLQPELFELFNVGEDLVVYSDIEDLYEKAAYYLSHEDERLQIAHNGYDRVKKDFTFDQRLEQML